MMQGDGAKAELYPILLRRAARDAAVTLAAVLILAGGVVVALGLSAWAIAKAAAVPLLLFLLAGPHLREHMRDALGAANRLTLLRAVAVALLAAFVGEPAAQAQSPHLVALACTAFGLDWLDGQVARATGSASPFGARLDMELDALTVLVLCLLALGLGRAGPWVLLAGLARYLFVAAGWALPWMAAPLPPASYRAIACGVGITFLIGSLLPWAWAPLGTALAAAGTLTIVGSFSADVAWLWRHR